MKFMGSRVHQLTCNSSNHMPIYISLSGLDPHVHKNVFHFKQMWLSNTVCEEVVHSAWNSIDGVEVDGEILAKVDKCGKDLSWWDKNVFGNVQMELVCLKKLLDKEERVAMLSGNNFRVRQVKKEIEVLLDKESTMWAQRSRVLWVKQGDRNTKYFYCYAIRKFRKKSME